jgi:hypothetical protein
MNIGPRLKEWRSWVPVPQEGGRPWLVRWVLLDANRLAVTGALLTGVFATIVVVGELYTFEMQKLLVETAAVQSILDTFLSGIILLVSVVVSINSIALSHDITSLQQQEDRVNSVVEFREEVSQLAGADERPTDPGSFLALMAEIIQAQTAALKEVAEAGDEELVEEIEEYTGTITKTAERLTDSGGGAEFSVIWLGLEVDYGPHLDRSRSLKTDYASELSEDVDERIDDLVRSVQLFATGKEYFKTLYYTQEVSQLSRTLLVVSLPAILVTVVTILAIDAELLPDFWLLGLPPLLVFVASSFAIAFVPFLVLTSYILRLATVARRTASAGPFSLSR